MRGEEDREIKGGLSEHPRINGIVFLFLFIGFCLLIFVCSVYFKITAPRKLPKLQITKVEEAFRGQIYSADGFILASSKKLYKVSVMKKSIHPKKKELFIKLFSIYSNINENEVRQKLNSADNYTILSYRVEPLQALHIKDLNIKLNKLGVFREYEEGGKITPRYGLSVEASGESRDYLYGHTLEPILGYSAKIEEGGYTKPLAIKGIEKYYNETLRSRQDGLRKVYRDISFNPIHSKSSLLKQRIDGGSVVLTVPLKLQKKIENILDLALKGLDANEVLAGIMDSKTGAIISLASSARFDPKNIGARDVSSGSINAKAVEVSFEPGSTMKPIVYAIALEQNLVTPDEIFNLHDGQFYLGKFLIKDSISAKYGSAENIIVNSSNIGMVQMAKKIPSKTYHNGLRSFGFGELTNIDLPHEKTGLVPKVSLLESEVYKGSVSYGYSIRSTFIQMLAAYSIFSNDGFRANPHLLKFSIVDDKKYPSKIPPNMQIISKETAKHLQNALIKTVQQGTAKSAKVDGIIMGGKTGTARIAEHGKYGNKYNSSFFGFIKDDKRNYTIGVVVFNANAKSSYYASQTANPIAKKIIETLIEEGYLNK